jgi:hypothetical protein
VCTETSTYGGRHPHRASSLINVVKSFARFIIVVLSFRYRSLTSWRLPQGCLVTMILSTGTDISQNSILEVTLRVLCVAILSCFFACPPRGRIVALPSYRKCL